MSICLRRRDFVAALGVAAAWPVASSAQQQTKPTIGWLSTQPGVARRDAIDAFRRGLAEIGFLEGRDVTVDYRTAAGHLEQLPLLAADLVRRRVAVIFAQTVDSALAAKAARGLSQSSLQLAAIQSSSAWWRASIVPAGISPASPLSSPRLPESALSCCTN
jgi:hypothetical protein